MKKLLVASVMLVPLLGCAGIVSDNSGGFGGGSAAEGGAGAESGRASAAGGVSASGGNSPGGVCAVDTLPGGVQALFTSKCVACHGAVPLSGLPALVSYANLTAPSKTVPSETNAALALGRIQSTTSPMPPTPGTRATASEIAALQDFISQGYPRASCPTITGGAGGTTGMDPLNATPTCTSNATWNSGNRGSASMNPGMACISCHKSGEGPAFSIAGTVYPTGHEPALCNGTAGNDGARIVIIGADGKMLTLTPNAVGNFSSNTVVKTPYQAKVTYQGRERLMLTSQSTGDCNSCHSQNGSNSAPGRITVP